MKVDYNTFILNIDQFNTEQYLDNNPEIEQNFNQFYSYYLILYDEEKKKYNANTIKFKKSIMEQKNNKYTKITRDNDEFKKICNIENIKDADEKFLIIIRGYLNKICDETYDKVNKQIIDELINYENIHIFSLLSKEIINKCIFDSKYRNLYIKLCNVIWSNRELHYNLITIKKNNYDYYWHLNGDDNNNDSEITQYGPFKNESSVKNDAFKKINFKKYFLNYIQNLFSNKKIDIYNLEDEQFFDEKKKIISLCELIAILFIEKHINFKIINIVLINLLHLNNNFDPISEIEFELIDLILSKIKEKSIYFKFSDFNILLNEYIQILNLQLDTDISKRSKFFINKIILLLTNLLNDKDKNNLQTNQTYIQKIIQNNSKNYFSTIDKNTSLNKNIEQNKLHYNEDKFLDYLYKQNLEDVIFYIEQLDENNKYNCVKKMISLIIDKTKKYSLHFIHNILENLNNKSKNYHLLLLKEINLIIENITDIILDVHDIKDILIKLLNNINYDVKKKEELLLNINNNLNQDSDDDSDEDSDSKW